MHPLDQRWLSKQIHDMAGQGLQIVVTTQSPAFVTTARPSRFRAEVGLGSRQAKPLIARYVANHIQFESKNDGWQLIGEMINALAALKATSVGAPR